MFITKKKHDAITRQWDLRCADLIVMRDAETKRANGLAAELADFRAKRAKGNANLRNQKVAG